MGLQYKIRIPQVGVSGPQLSGPDHLCPVSSPSRFPFAPCIMNAHIYLPDYYKLPVYFMPSYGCHIVASPWNFLLTSPLSHPSFPPFPAKSCFLILTPSGTGKVIMLSFTALLFSTCSLIPLTVSVQQLPLAPV